MPRLACPLLTGSACPVPCQVQGLPVGRSRDECSDFKNPIGRPAKAGLSGRPHFRRDWKVSAIHKAVIYLDRLWNFIVIFIKTV